MVEIRFKKALCDEYLQFPIAKVSRELKKILGENWNELENVVFMFQEIADSEYILERWFINSNITKKNGQTINFPNFQRNRQAFLLGRRLRTGSRKLACLNV